MVRALLVPLLEPVRSRTRLQISLEDAVKRLLTLSMLVTLPALAQAQGHAPTDPVATPAPHEAQAAVAAAEVAVDAAEAAPLGPFGELFVKKCTSCHTVGRGNRVGPDLKGVVNRRERTWLARFIREPSTMLATDPEARKLVAEFGGVKMPDLGMSAEQTEGLIELLVRCSAEACNLSPQFRPVAEATAEDIAFGELLFTGEAAQTNGGPPCLSCHTVDGHDGGIGGGELAKNLTHSFARLGDEGIEAALAAPSFPLMVRIFADRPLESTEVFALRAFLNEANQATSPVDDSPNLLFFAFLGTIAVLILLNTIWSRRLRGVREEITSRRKTS